MSCTSALASTQSSIRSYQGCGEFGLARGQNLWERTRYVPRCPRGPRPLRSPWQNELTMTSRFIWALGVYAVLALMAAFTLEGNLRAAVWILLAGLTVKTCIAYKAGW